MTFIYNNVYLIYFIIYCICIYIVFGCIGSSLLHVGFLQLWRAGAMLFVAVCGLPIAVATFVAEHGL